MALFQLVTESMKQRGNTKPYIQLTLSQLEGRGCWACSIKNPQILIHSKVNWNQPFTSADSFSKLQFEHRCRSMAGNPWLRNCSWECENTVFHLLLVESVDWNLRITRRADYIEKLWYQWTCASGISGRVVKLQLWMYCKVLDEESKITQANIHPYEKNMKVCNILCHNSCISWASCIMF